MAHGTPDWVRMVQVAVTVENVPIVPEAATEVAAGAEGDYNGTEQTYQEVCSWTVSTNKVGELKEILIISNLYTKTVTKVTIGGVTWATDWTPVSAMPLIFEDLKLAAGTEVEVEVKSSDGTEIEVYAIIVGKEVG